MAELALTGGPKLRTAPFHRWPVVDDGAEQAVVEVLRSGKWGRLTGATKTKQFEERFAEYVGSEFALAVSTGTAALEVALVAAGVDIGDEVIVPPYTFMAGCTCVLLVGAVPVFVDIDPETYNLDPKLIEQAITPKTKAILPVHFGGLPADMDAINAIARKHNLVVIEDCAHAHGAIHARGKAGTLGDAGAWSFQMSKNITSGEGGAITTSNAPIYNKAILYHDFWRSALHRDEDEDYLPGRVNFPVLSWNYRLNEFAGALLLWQMDYIEEWAARRAENASYLNARLAQIEGLSVLRTDPFVVRNSVHSFRVNYTNPAAFKGISRATLLKAVNAEGIQVGEGYFAPVYRHPVFQNALTGALRSGFPLTSHYYGRHMDYREVYCPEAERACAETCVRVGGQSMFLGMKQDMDDIADAFLKVQEHADKLRAYEAAPPKAAQAAEPVGAAARR
jgi:dTDP-4-amino-4,6-dideoxygalactose transaminase